MPTRDDSSNMGLPTPDGNDTPAAMPAVVDRATWQAELDKLLVREKAHTREGDAIAAARRRLPMVEVDPAITLVGPDGPSHAARRLRGSPAADHLLSHVVRTGEPAEAQCEGCTFFNGQVRELSYLHSRDVTYATFCEGPYDESIRYRDFMGWDVPWYSAQDSADALLAGRCVRHAGVLPAPRRPGVRDLLDQRPRHRGHGPQLRPVGPDRVRPAGGLGGLARRLAATLADTK